jgi:hypothetical protein
MNRQPFSIRGFIVGGPEEEHARTVYVCFWISLGLAVIATVLFVVSRWNVDDTWPAKVYGGVGVAIGTLVFSFLILTIVMAVIRRFRPKHAPPPPPPYTGLDQNRWGD